jgi:hypothetical protein
MNLKEIEQEVMNWIHHIVQYADYCQTFGVHGDEYLGSIKCTEFLE